MAPAPVMSSVLRCQRSRDASRYGAKRRYAASARAHFEAAATCADRERALQGSELILRPHACSPNVTESDDAAVHAVHAAPGATWQRGIILVISSSTTPPLGTGSRPRSRPIRSATRIRTAGGDAVEQGVLLVQLHRQRFRPLALQSRFDGFVAASRERYLRTLACRSSRVSSVAAAPSQSPAKPLRSSRRCARAAACMPGRGSRFAACMHAFAKHHMFQAWIVRAKLLLERTATTAVLSRGQCIHSRHMEPPKGCSMAQRSQLMVPGPSMYYAS